MTGTKQTSKGNRTLAWEEQSIPEPNTNRITVLLQLKETELRMTETKQTPTGNGTLARERETHDLHLPPDTAVTCGLATTWGVGTAQWSERQTPD